MSPESLIPILLVDDEPKNLLAEEALLERPDYQIVRAASGEEALRCLLTTDFAVILLDVVMPGLDGYQTATLIRSRERSSRTPIIFLTAQVESPLRQFEGYTAGAVDFIFKPLTEPVILQTKVAVFADLFRQREEIKQHVDQLTAVNQQLQTEIAHRQQAEAALQRANAELEQRVLERTASLSAATEESRTLYQNGARARRALLSALEDQQQASETLRESEDRFRRLSAAAFEAIIIHEGGVLLSANDQYYEMFGYEPEELLGKQALPLTMAPEAIESIRKKIATGGVGQYEAIGLKKDGTKFPIEIRVREGEYEGRKVRVAAIMNITERKRIEEELRKLNIELEQRVADRTAELSERIKEVEQLNRGMSNLMEDLQASNRRATEAARQLDAKNREMEAFNYSVSHDLKAPLRGIDGYSRLLLEDYTDRLDEEGRYFLKTIRDSVGQMNQLIDDLLAYSRMESRSFVARQVDPRTLVEAVLTEHAGELKERNVTVNLDILCTSVTAEAEGLTQVFRNLIDNAIKFTRDIPEPNIEISSQETEKSCIISIYDNGIGFDMKYHNRIFDIFQRLHRAEDYPGTGIGLAIVRKAMERMGGRIWAESKPGEGATFYVEVPR